MKTGDTIKFRLDGHPANEGEGKFVEKRGKQITVSLTKLFKDFKIGDIIIIWPEEIIK